MLDLVITWKIIFVISSILSKPSLVRSTKISKNPNPRAEVLWPANKLFDHPRLLSSDKILPLPSCPIKWVKYCSGCKAKGRKNKWLLAPNEISSAPLAYACFVVLIQVARRERYSQRSWILDGNYRQFAGVVFRQKWMIRPPWRLHIFVNDGRKSRYYHSL